jgi:hypothetical protein
VRGLEGLQNGSDPATGEEGRNCSVFEIALQKVDEARKGRRGGRRLVGRRMTVFGNRRLDEAGCRG